MQVEHMPIFTSFLYSSVLVSNNFFTINKQGYAYSSINCLPITDMQFWSIVLASFARKSRFHGR
jgi:hypothetical protein